MSDFLRPYARLFCPWDSLAKNTRVHCHFILQGIFLIQGLNLHFLSPALAGRFFTLSLQGSPIIGLGSYKLVEKAGK